MRPRAVAVDLEESEGEREPGSVEAAERGPSEGVERGGESERATAGAEHAGTTPGLTTWGTFAPVLGAVIALVLCFGLLTPPVRHRYERAPTWT